VRGRYAAILRYGPPNTRWISRIESDDFVHWSPKVTVLPRSLIDEPLETELYQMVPMQYEGVYFGLISTYNGGTMEKIPKGQEWKDRVNVQLAYSRNGVTWHRVGADGIAPHVRRHHREPENKNFWKHWRDIARKMTFIPCGRGGKDWDWGQIYPCYPPQVVGNEIRIYYMARAERHYARHHNAIGPNSIGLATLRLDGFMSLEAAKAGTITTRKFVFIGDTLEMIADTAGESIRVEALDAKGDVIQRFSKKDCTPITTDRVRHILRWKGKSNCRLLQVRSTSLRFHVNKAKLYFFTPRIRHKHYVRSYDCKASMAIGASVQTNRLRAKMELK
jgi:hypothetical protein